MERVFVKIISGFLIIMKIVFLVSHLLSGGAERTVAYLSKEFAERGAQTTVLSISDKVFYETGEGVTLKTLGVKDVYKTVFGKIANIIKRFCRVKSFLKEQKPDVVFCMLPETARYVLHLKKRLAFKLITSERNYPFGKSKKSYALKEKIFAASDGVIFQTERAKECYQESIAKKGVVIQNAVGNPDCYKIKAEPLKEKKFSAVGRLNAQKDYPTLIKAFAEFGKTYPDYTLEIFGGGKPEELISLCETLGVISRVRFCGVEKAVLEKISDSTAFILSSAFEGMPNALMEAMAIGLPCISSDCPFGPRELINDGVNGILFPVGDHIALASAMTRVAEDKDFALGLGEKAKQILQANDIKNVSEIFYTYVTNVYEQSDDKT